VPGSPGRAAAGHTRVDGEAGSLVGPGPVDRPGPRSADGGAPDGGPVHPYRAGAHWGDGHEPDPADAIRQVVHGVRRGNRQGRPLMVGRPGTGRSGASVAMRRRGRSHHRGGRRGFTPSGSAAPRRGGVGPPASSRSSPPTRSGPPTGGRARPVNAASPNISNGSSATGRSSFTTDASLGAAPTSTCWSWWPPRCVDRRLQALVGQSRAAERRRLVPDGPASVRRLSGPVQNGRRDGSPDAGDQGCLDDPRVPVTPVLCFVDADWGLFPKSFTFPGRLGDVGTTPCRADPSGPWIRPI
jgi:hypothetical protein